MNFENKLNELQDEREIEKKKEEEYKRVQQMILKIQTNSYYPVTFSPVAIMYNDDSAKRVSELGKEHLKQLTEWMKKN